MFSGVSPFVTSQNINLPFLRICRHIITFLQIVMFLTIRMLLRSRYAVAIPVLLRTCFFWDVTLYCLNDTLLNPQAFNVKTLLFEYSDNTNPETDHYMPGDLIPILLRLPTLQTQKTHAIYKTAWTPLMLLQHSPLLTIVYRCNISIAVSGLIRGMVADTWRWTSYPTKENVNVLGNAQPEETCLMQSVSYNMEPQLR